MYHTITSVNHLHIWDKICFTLIWGFPSHFYKHACEFASHFFRCFTVSFTAVVEVLHSCPGVSFTVRFTAIVGMLHSWLGVGFTVRFTAIVGMLHS